MLNKISIIFYFALFSTLWGYSQSINYSKVSKLEPTLSSIYDTTSIAKYRYFLSMDFAKDLAKNGLPIQELLGQHLVKIELVYTQYRHHHSFNQIDLNYSRLQYLDQLIPQLKVQKQIKWELIEQTGCSSRDSCKNLFHGFVIHYYDPLEPETNLINEKNSDLDKLINQLETEGLKQTDVSQKESDSSDIICKEYKIIEDEWTGYYIPRSNLFQSLNMRFKRKSIFNRHLELHEVEKNVTVCKDKIGREMKFDNPKSNKKIILRSLKNYPIIQDNIVVVDVTSSMDKYLAQVLFYVKEMSRQGFSCKFVFFNDGNGKSDHLKKTGQTGGIYSIESNNPDEIIALAKKAKRSGDGGDFPENDIEAILKGIKKWPYAKNIILIADNRGEIKDISMATQIPNDYKVNIISVFAKKKIDLSYVKLAYYTKGNIHLMKDDYLNLWSKNKKLIVIGKKTFETSHNDIEFY